MVSIVIKRRTITFIVLCLFGLALFTLILRGSLFSNKSLSPDLPVTKSSSGEITFENMEPSKASLPVGDDFFVEYKLERERTRGQSVEWLREVINNTNSTSETRQKAQEHLMAISRNMEKEIEMESLLKAKGFKDAAVLVDERAVTVVVEAAHLSAGESSQITDLVFRGTGVDLQNIIIITKT
ncbi:MAG: SpoIIIAH-like family protein [Desulfotomaculaceae bacterium]